MLVEGFRIGSATTYYYGLLVLLGIVGAQRFARVRRRLYLKIGLDRGVSISLLDKNKK
jgi:prolipoprotein diacylglyceryltransferase